VSVRKSWKHTSVHAVPPPQNPSFSCVSLTCSRVLCSDISSGSRRPPPRQLTPLPRRALFPRRLRLHPRPRPKTLPRTNETLPRNGRRHGRHHVPLLRAIQIILFHRLYHPAKKCQSHSQFVQSYGRCEYPGYSHRAG